ncbi:MAG: DUF924 family protein [Pseudomonadota bacterium]|nr:DUF924 family protein [Pseudomonadota bacterium]
MRKSKSSSNVLDFWFREILSEQWYKKDRAFDETIRDRFEPTVTAALASRLDGWANDADGCLALILLLDQFTRNIYRDTPRAFSGDEMGLALSLRCAEREYLSHDDPAYRQFMLMPMMHSEDLAIQERSLPLFESLTNPLTYEYAVKHRDIIARFGRFPHRNAILGRPSSDEELEFLKQPGSSF